MSRRLPSRMPAIALLAAASLAAVTATATGQETDPPPRARARVEAGQALVSAPTTLTVEVLTSTYFRGAVRFPDTLPVEDAVVVQSTRGGGNFSEREGGVSWTGIRRAYLVYPTRPGTITIPAIEFEVVYGLSSGAASEPTPATTDPVSFEVRLPQGMDPSRTFLVTTDLSAQQQVEPSTDPPRVGDTIERRVTLSVQNTPGIFLPAVAFDAPAGTRVYPGQPELGASGGERGTARVATRTDSASYLLQQEGTLELPALEISWWNLEAGRVETTTLPGARFEVGPAPPPEVEFGAEAEESASAPDPRPAPTPWARFALLLVGAAIVAAIIRRLVRGRAATAPTPREREAAAFDEVRRAARARDARATESALVAWLSARATGSGTPTLAQLCAEAADPELERSITALQNGLYGSHPTAQVSAELLPALDRFRARRPLAQTAAALPALNP